MAVNVEWDKELNGVILTDEPSKLSLSYSPRPVYPEELNMLGMRELRWDYPDCSSPLCWAMNKRYFYHGDCVLKVTGGDMFEEPEITITPGNENLKLSPIDIDKVIKKNTAHLDALEEEALNFITENYQRVSGAPIKNEVEIDWIKLKERQEEYSKTDMAVVQRSCGSLDIMPLDAATKENIPIIRGGKVDAIVVSFSGGKDSQVVLDLVTRAISSDKYSVAYSDTGYELPSSLHLYEETGNFYKNKFPDIKFHVIKNHQPIMFYWDHMGPPSRMQRWCCAVMKTAPIYRYLKEQTGFKKQLRVLVYEGVRAEESTRRAGYLRVGKSVKHQGVTNARPIFKWNNTEVYLYILRHHLPFNKAYQQGLARVGCALCPFSTTWSEHVVMKNYPQTMQPFVCHLKRGAEEIGVNDIRDYIRTGNWKMRAGGRILLNQESYAEIADAGDDFSILLTNPKEDIVEWLKAVGKCVFNGNDGYVEWKPKGGGGASIKQLFQIERFGATRMKIVFPQLATHTQLKNLILRVVNKSTYCVHCEACEVECPTGALTVTPKVSIDTSKCVHCHSCLMFKDKGCMVARSLAVSYMPQPQTISNKKTNLDRYHGYGLKKEWLYGYLHDIHNFFFIDHDFIRSYKERTALKNWLRDAGLLNLGDLTPTPLAISLSKEKDEETLWKTVWKNLIKRSPVCNELVQTQTIPLRQNITKAEIISAIKEHRPTSSERTITNAVESLFNLFLDTPLNNYIFDNHGQLYFRIYY